MLFADGNARTRGVKVNDIECTRQVLRVDDLGDLIGRLKETNVTFVSPDIMTLSGGTRVATIRDPDGHMIVLTA